MGLFKRNVIACPYCDYQFGKDETAVDHFSEHITDMGGGEYMYICSACKEQDGVWNNDFGAVAGLMLHAQQRHGFQIV